MFNRSIHEQYLNPLYIHEGIFRYKQIATTVRKDNDHRLFPFTAFFIVIVSTGKFRFATLDTLKTGIYLTQIDVF